MDMEMIYHQPVLFCLNEMHISICICLKSVYTNTVSLSLYIQISPSIDLLWANISSD